MVEPRSAAVQVKIVGSQPVGTRLAKGLGRKRRVRPTSAQAAWLRHGLAQPGGELPLFDEVGQHYNARTVRACLDRGWAAPWIGNPLKPDWLVCKLTEAGRNALTQAR